MAVSSEKNLYGILEISAEATPAVIKSAYRRLARKYHPDVNSGNAACIKKFKDITEAYEVLSDEEKKKNYDMLRGFYKHEDIETKRKQANKAYKESKNFEDKAKKEDSEFSNIFNDIFEGFKKTAGGKNFEHKQTYPEKGSDVFTEVSITLSEALKGTARKINILHTQKCLNCEGRKFINGAKCPLCNGLGEQSVYKKLSVKIPPNVKNGSKIRIANEGNKGYNGGKNGDLYLNVKIESGDIFKFEGLNILCTIPITPSEAVLGASINIPAADGNVVMKIMPNTQSGQKFRLSGQGLKGSDKTSGDMIVTVNIEIPKNLSKKELELYEELQNLSKKDIRENLFNEKS